MSLLVDADLVLNDPRQLKALGDETRARILRILQTREASAKQLCELLDMTHGKVGHHIKVLREAGLIEVVEERKVRAMTEKLYGLTYKTLRVDLPNHNRLAFSLNQAALEASDDQPFEPVAPVFIARMTERAAKQFHDRVVELAKEFASTDEPDGDMFGFVGSVFATDTPT